ncbi:YbaK/EbsC family protein [Lacisediminihabitans sp.]|uniref:YbaK/EbsC family protein n=1 Tax=Lacisediminihabitans sp. TaxID=2787631 RepID=UPI00374C91BE
MIEDTPQEVRLVEGVLLAHGIEPRTHWFEASTATALEAAAALGVDVGAIANSLVFRLDGEVIMIIASGAHRVDTHLLGDRLGGSLARASAGVGVGRASARGLPHHLRGVIAPDRRNRKCGRSGLMRFRLAPFTEVVEGGWARFH